MVREREGVSGGCWGVMTREREHLRGRRGGGEKFLGVCYASPEMYTPFF